MARAIFRALPAALALLACPILPADSAPRGRLSSLAVSKALNELPSRTEAPGAGEGAAANAFRAIRASLEGVDPAILGALAQRGLVLRILRGGDLLSDTIPIPDPMRRIGIPPSGSTHSNMAVKGEITINVNEAGLLGPDDLPPVPEGYRRTEPLSTLIHELAHAVDAASGRQSQEFRCGLFERRREAGGPFVTRYAAQRCREYFADSAAVYFGTKRFDFSSRSPGVSSSEGAGPAWLRKSDPDLHAELERTFGPARDLHGLALDARGEVFPGEPLLPVITPRPRGVRPLAAPRRAPQAVQPRAAPPEFSEGR